VTFERQLEVSEELIRKWHGAAGGRLNLAVMFPTIDPSAGSFDRAELPEIKRQAQAMRDLSKRHGLLFTQDGHTTGTVQFAHDELNLLGTDAIFSHSTDLTRAEIDLLARTGTRIVHNPSAIAAIRRPFQLVEMLDAGVLVMLGSDGVAPDRSYDMFRHMFQAMRYHRARLRDASVVPAGKVLEMVTIDAAKALGIDSMTGSLEPGKRADVILVDMFRPHLVPMNMPAYRIAYFANGNDVSTVIVDGRILRRDRQVLSVNEPEVLELAEREAEAAIRRTGLERLKEVPEGFWGRSRLR
jgi:cytosine/adenosine deaminase-related metal-dependent hydrolase